ncbi:DNA-binding XRE family transcriptional regulator [Ereboglobus sp. PH5-10]|uniref:helix-turn-helix domain-containing protein n=1 Tax=Ereboglobus sp. PH5-10 TaxID=2940629 RepID=UPI002406417C|nr:helix-turn-helix transcriptional regulator [Ereboglobus sp. PH5-10]MDF9827508.1 DNA-binding XRE family transcriptional regulator [Ereboglobus sp. PH5-10]
MPATLNRTQRALGQAIREIRKEAGYSQEGFALEADINRAYFGNIERGEKNVSLSMLMRICAVLRTKPSAIFLRAKL